MDWTGRVIREDKRGAIPQSALPILERLQLTEKEWLLHTQHFESRFKRAAGTWKQLQQLANTYQQQWLQGKPPNLATS